MGTCVLRGRCRRMGGHPEWVDPEGPAILRCMDSPLDGSLAEPRLLIERENKPGTDAVQDLCSLQPTVQTNQLVESFYVMISA